MTLNRFKNTTLNSTDLHSSAFSCHIWRYCMCTIQRLLTGEPIAAYRIHNVSHVSFRHIICCDRNLLYFLQFSWMQLWFGEANLCRSSSVWSCGSNQQAFMFEGLTDWPMHAVEVDMMLMDLPTIPFSMHQSWHGKHWTITQFPHLAPFVMSWKLHLPYMVVICFILQSTLKWLFSQYTKSFENHLKRQICPISRVLHHFFFPKLQLCISLCIWYLFCDCVDVEVNNLPSCPPGYLRKKISFCVS